jgi:hypothetical protein
LLSIRAVRRERTPELLDLAAACFRDGIEVVYLFTDDEAGVRLSTSPPDSTVFVAARSIRQVERFLSELQRRSA